MKWLNNAFYHTINRSIYIEYCKVIEIKDIQNISYSVDVQQYLVFMSDIENL